MVGMRRGALALAVAAGCALAAPVKAEPAWNEPGFIPIHGNWCGPGNRSQPGYGALPPVDMLDSACMRHDYCADVYGAGSCGCDLAFLDELRHQAYGSPHEAIKARAIFDGIAMLPCLGPETAIKQSWFMETMVDDMATGRSSPWDAPLRMLYTTTHRW